MERKGIIYTTKDYVFIHFNKAAGVFVKDYLIAKHGAEVHKYKHSPILYLGESHRQKIKIGVVRNPFSWYVSFYSYRRQEGEYENMTFGEWMRTYMAEPRALINNIPKKKVRKKLPELIPPKPAKMNIGPFTHHYIHFFSYNRNFILKNWTDDDLRERFNEVSNLNIMMRTESLKDDMIKLFGDYDEIRKLQPKNTSEHRHYRTYYTPELRALVEERDGIALKELGYEF